MKRLAAVLIVLCLPVLIFAKSWGTWTVMVYIVADNNLEQYGLIDMNEMEKGMFDDIGIRVITEIDRIDGYDTSDGDWTGARRYFIKHDEQDTIGSELILDMGEINMGDGNELTSFVGYCVENYPARSYMLVIWDHGFGWIDQGYDHDEQPCPRHRITKSIGADSTSKDELTLTEIYNTLDVFKNMTGQKLDILGFDACLMQQVDVAYQFEPLVDYIVASELSEPGDGWPYEPIVDHMCDNIAVQPKHLSSKMCEFYHQSYEGITWASTTLSSVKCSSINETVGLISSLSKALMNQSLSESFSSVVTGSTTCLSASWDKKITHYYLDLFDFAKNLGADSTYSAIPDVASACAALQAQIYDGQQSGEVSDGQVASQFSSNHPVRLRIFRDQWVPNQVAPRVITRYFPEDMSVYYWDKGTVNISISFSDTDSGFSSNIATAPMYGGGSYFFTSSDGRGYSIQLFPSVHHTACPSSSEYVDLNGTMTVTALGKSNVKRLIRANFTRSSSWDVNVDNAGGISMWYPLLKEGESLPSWWEIEYYRNLRFARDTFWDELVIQSLSPSTRAYFLGYGIINGKAERALQAQGMDATEALDSLKAELRLNMETGLHDNVEQFVADYSSSEKLAPLCRELASTIKSIKLMQEKSGHNWEE